AGVIGALTPEEVLQILPKTLRHRGRSKTSIGRSSMTTTTSRRSLLRSSAATVAAVGLGSKLVSAQDAPIRIGVIYDLSGPFAAAGLGPLCDRCADRDRHRQRAWRGRGQI